MKKIIFILLLIPSLSFSQMDDSQKHMFAGAIINVAANEITYQITGKIGLSFVVGNIVSIAATVAKEEIYDKRMGKGVYNKQDINAGLWGTSVASVGVVIPLNYHRRNKKEEIKNFK